MSRPPIPPFAPPPPAPLLPRPERNPHEQRSVTVSRAGLPANALLELDIDDGVKVNHLKLAEVLVAIAGLAKEEE